MKRYYVIDNLLGGISQTGQNTRMKFIMDKHPEFEKPELLSTLEEIIRAMILTEDEEDIC